MNDSPAHSMYFVAIVSPPPVDKKVQRYKYWMKDQFGCVVALKSPVHITLIPPFWLDERRESELLNIFQSFTSDMDELEIQLDSFSHFGKKVLFVHIKEDPVLQELQQQTEDYFLQHVGDVIKKDERPFRPHITLANRDMKPGDFEKAWHYFSEKIFHETFHSRTVSLLKLNLGKWNILGEKSW